MKIVWTTLIGLLFVVFVTSCSKEDDEIPLAESGVSAADFNHGYLGIWLEDNNKKADSIIYLNTTRGNSLFIESSEIIFVHNIDTGSLSKSLYNGKTGENVECCVYLNSAAVIGVTFDEDAAIVMDTVPAGKYCVAGKY